MSALHRRVLLLTASLLALALACGGADEKKDPAPTAGETKSPGEDKPDEAKPDEAKPDEAKPPGGDKSPGEDKPDEAKPGAEPEEEKPDGVKDAEPEQKKVAAVPPEIQAAAKLAMTDPKAAKAQFESLLRKNPRLHQAQVNLGILAEREGDLAAAERQLRGALATKPDDPEALRNLTRLMMRTRRTGEAVSAAEQGLARNPESLELQNALTTALIADGQLGRAETATKKVLKADERDVEAMLNLGDIYAKRDKFELADFIYEKAADLDAANADMWYRRARVTMRLYEKTKAPFLKAKAIEALKKAVAVDPAHALAQNNLGSMLLATGDVPGGLQALKYAVDARPDHPDVHLNYANALRANKKYKEAEAEYQKVLTMRADAPKALFNLGLLYLDNEVPGHEDLIKRLDLAIAQLTKFQEVSFGKKVPKGDMSIEYIEEAEKLKAREAKRIERSEKRRLRNLKNEERKKKREAEEAAKKAEDEAKAAEEAKKAESEKKDEVPTDAAPQGEKKDEGPKDAAPESVESEKKGGAEGGATDDKVDEGGK